jgi:monovalent cation/proton antiporter MnhG/PhaG subunit
MTEALAILFLLAGGAVTLIAAIGVARLPDAFLRMHAATKAGVVGSGLILIGVGFAFNDFDTWLRVGLIVAFLLVTTPVSAHGLGLGAYLGGAPLWGGTTADQLAGVLKRHAFDETAEQAAQRRREAAASDAPPRRVLVALAGGTGAAASIEAGLLRLPEGPKRLTLFALVDVAAFAGRDPARLAAARAEAAQLAEEVGRIADGLGLPWTLVQGEGDAAARWREAARAHDIAIAPIAGWFDQGRAEAPERSALRFADPAALPLLLPAPGAEPPERLLVLAEEPGAAAALMRRFLASGLDPGAALLLAATGRAGGPAALAEAAALARAAGREVAVLPDALADDAAPDVTALGAEGVVLDGSSAACRDAAAETPCRRVLREAAPSVLLA